MHKNGYKKRIVFLSISLIITVVILGAGVAYAYFAMTLRNVESSSTIYVSSGSISVKYTSGTNQIIAENILPGWSANKYFNITSVNKTSKTYSYDINIYVEQNNFSLTNNAGDNYLSYSLNKCSSSESGCTTSLATGTVNRKFYEVKVYTENISRSTAGTKYYALTLKYPNDASNEQSQYGTDGNILKFIGHITITSDDRLSQ